MDEAVRPARHGSETRQRTATVLVRLTPTELSALTDRATAAGLSAAGYCRAAALGAAGPRARRRGRENIDMMRRLLAVWGKLGANVNQLAARANRGDTPARDELAAASQAVRESRDALIIALGRQA